METYQALLAYVEVSGQVEQLSAVVEGHLVGRELPEDNINKYLICMPVNNPWVSAWWDLVNQRTSITLLIIGKEAGSFLLRQASTCTLSNVIGVHDSPTDLCPWCWGSLLLLHATLPQPIKLLPIYLWLFYCYSFQLSQYSPLPLCSVFDQRTLFVCHLVVHSVLLILTLFRQFSMCLWKSHLVN